jgi:phosphoribosylanthranilate isomerase
MYIKICGITKLDQAQAIAKMGVDALGFICVPSSPRYINASIISKITANLNLDLVGVFLNASAIAISQTVEQCGLNAVQLHGDESPEFCRELRSQLDQIKPKIKLIKALRIKNQADLESAKLFSNVVNAILLDAYDPQMAGGTGKTLDWKMLRDFRPNCNWWLAGGLSGDNVAEAIALVDPDGLDVSSGVELAAGDKDLLKVEKFVAIARLT